jgi:GDPmannose 4,6-dehydratase
LPKRAFITGISGQDGSFLAEILLQQGVEVHGLIRRLEHQENHRLSQIFRQVHLHTASLQDADHIQDLIGQIRPDEVYHLAAQTFVGYALDAEQSTLNTNISGTHHLLQAIKVTAPTARFVLASSCEVFGAAQDSPQSELTAFQPRSVYGISKMAAQSLTTFYRQHHKLHASSAILYNHESPRRGLEFVTRKISSTIAKIRAGRASELALGNLEAARDWGHAHDYMRALHLMAQQDLPDDFVIASGNTRTVREFLDCACQLVGLDYQDFVRIDERFFRPLDPVVLRGDATKAKERLGWIPKYTFQDMVREMMMADLVLEGVPLTEIVA